MKTLLSTLCLVTLFIEFQMEDRFKEDTTLRFGMSRDVKGTFDFCEAHVKSVK